MAYQEDDDFSDLTEHPTISIKNISAGVSDTKNDNRELQLLNTRVIRMESQIADLRNSVEEIKTLLLENLNLLKTIKIIDRVGNRPI